MCGFFILIVLYSLQSITITCGGGFNQPPGSVAQSRGINPVVQFSSVASRDSLVDNSGAVLPKNILSILKKLRYNEKKKRPINKARNTLGMRMPRYRYRYQSWLTFDTKNAG